MSFILDALKKSEKERQREAVPGISDLPIVIHETRTSTWVVAVITALGLGVIALVWAWWQTSNEVPTIAGPPPAVPAIAEPPIVERLIPAPEPAVVAPEPVAGTTTRNLANEAARIATAANRPPGTEPLVVQPTPAVITPAPMSILQARAAGLAVPELTLELLVYSPEPAQRFVFINASKYVEGETLAAGPRLIEISPEGAILSYGGQNFLLPQE